MDDKKEKEKKVNIKKIIILFIICMIISMIGLIFRLFWLCIFSGLIIFFAVLKFVKNLNLDDELRS